MDLTPESRSEFAARLLEQLLTIYLEETKAICSELNYKIEELSPVSPDMFVSKGVTSDLKEVRYSHHEERRIAIVIKIASEVLKKLKRISYSATESLKSLLQGVNNARMSRGNSSAQTSRCGSYSAMTRPQDYIALGHEREQEKFNRSLKTLERLSFLRNEEKLKAERKLKQFEEKDRIIMRNRSKKEDEFQKTVSLNVERRKKILEKKYEILQGIDKIFANYGVELEKRMEKLSEVQKVEMREKLKRKERKLKARLRNEKKKSELEQKTTHEESIHAGELIQQIYFKINQRVNEYLQNVKSRVQSAKNHFVKVNNTLQTSLMIDSMNRTVNTRNCVNKSLLSSKKLEKKHKLAHESSEKMKKMMNQSFQNHKRGISEITTDEFKRMEKVKKRNDSKQRSFADIQRNIAKKYQEKRQQNFLRMENHFRSYIEKQRNDVLYM